MWDAKYFLVKLFFVMPQSFLLKLQALDVKHETNFKAFEILRGKVKCNDAILSGRKHDDHRVGNTARGFDNTIQF